MPKLLHVVDTIFGHQVPFFERNLLGSFPIDRLFEISNTDYLFMQIVHVAVTGTFDGPNLIKFSRGSIEETRKYDNQNRVIESSSSKDGTTIFQYSKLDGRLIYAKHVGVADYTFEYDADGNRVRTRNLTDNTSIRREYTADNLIASVHTDDGYHEYYTYNDKRNCIEFKHNCFSQKYVETNVYDDHNNVIAKSSCMSLDGTEYNNTVQHNYTYYDDGQLRSFNEILIPFYEK